MEVKIFFFRYVLLALFGMLICGAWVYKAGITTSATNIGLIYALAPIFIAVVSFYYNSETLNFQKLFYLFMALIGVFFIIFKGDLNSLIALSFVPGDLWILSAMFSWVFYSSLLKYWKSSLDGVCRLAVTSLFGVVILFPFAVYELIQIDWYIPQRGLILIFIAALIPGLFSYLAYSFVINELGPSHAALVMYLAPIYNSFLAWVLFSESLYWYHLVGSLLILPSIFFISISNNHEKGNI
jgi:drug/metabolite transporter (DMT)-like permease